MNYLEWNNCIASYFFNPGNSSKDIRLYITKGDIINIGRSTFTDKTDEDIWQDFLSAIKIGMPGSGSHSTIVEKAVYCLKQWKSNLKAINGVEISFPPYISYLAFFILPLTEGIFELHARNYYGRLSAFLKAHQIDQRINTLHDMEPLWEDLEEWSIITMNGDIGFFSLGKYSANYKYVGKPFSQCIFSPVAIRKLPELFFQSGMIPSSFYSDREIKNNLLEYGSSILGLKNNILELISKHESNELGQSIIQLTKREYTNWTGESHELVTTGIAERTKRNYTVSPLLLQFRLNTNDGEIKFSFRMFSSNDYPEDLKFGDHEILNAGKGFSNILNLPNSTTLTPFDLKDDFNKWIARFPRKDVRLFTSASFYHLSSDYWIETETLSKTDNMFLLCRTEARSVVQEWGRHFKPGNFKIVDDLKGLPDDYSLFTLLNPLTSLPSIPVLTVYFEKTIQLNDGLKISHRSFTNDFLPDVEIINADGNERVYLQYRKHEDKIFLRKKQAYTNRWVLPDGIVFNSDFHFKVENENFSGNDIAYSIVSTDDSALRLDGNSLPRRDAFGRKTDKQLSQYSVGSNTVGINLLRQIPYRQFFRGVAEDIIVETSLPEYAHDAGNILLSFLTYKQITSTEEFYSAFEFLHSQQFGNRSQESNINYSKIKKAALNMYDYLGFLDYDYESKEIVVNPPQLIFIPVDRGRKVLLIGGRDASLVRSVLKAAPRHNLKVEIIKQSLLNENLLLPDAITIKSFGNRKENFGESNIRALARELNIKFEADDLIQVSMQQFAADIDEYQADLLLNNETSKEDYDWARKIFNTDSLLYERVLSQTFDQSFSLIEYKLNEYTYNYKLWKDQKCYLVDKNWGKFLALRYAKKQVILYDSKKHKVAIPLELPLPRLLAESIILLSGIAPVYERVDDRAYRIYENIPGIFIKNLFDKLKQVTIEFNL